MHAKFQIALLACLALTISAWAETPARDAGEFHDLFRSTLPAEMQSADVLATLHLLPDANIIKANKATSATDALRLVRASSIDGLITATQSASLRESLSADEELKMAPLTIVIVPGIFGEFIPTRAFEDVLSQPSNERDEFLRQVKEAASKDDPNAKDAAIALPELAAKTLSLDQVVNVGTLKDANGRAQARVVLLYTGFMSLESFADLGQTAAIFNRRLAKYLALTGPQRMMFVGYSRGDDLGLEMLAQAKAQKLPWLSSVKAMVSLSGVNWGSSVADSILDPASPLFGLISAVKDLRAKLDPNSRLTTVAAWIKFSARAVKFLPAATTAVAAPKAKDTVGSLKPATLDAGALIALLKLAWTHIGLDHPWDQFARNVKSFQIFVDAVLSGATSLTSQAREDWWKNNVLPKSVTYYAINAAMTNPDSSLLDEQIFDGAYSYSHRSYDDLLLLQNRLSYEATAKIALNDSQISVAQSLFLPNAIAKLNPANAGLQTKFLGTLGTHHWGLALKVVNAMKDGRTNPFPREALLRALAAKVAHDLKSETN